MAEDIVLAVEALHSLEIHHRDLKADNLRAYQNTLKRIVVAIDLGTAARAMCPSLAEDYHNNVGAPWYAAPEAICGFAGDRVLSRYTDVYALGCLLFELFNPTYFGAFVRRTHIYESVLAAIAVTLAPISRDQKRSELNRVLSSLSTAISPVSISMTGSTLPLAISTLLDDVLKDLTHFDYRKRSTNLEKIRRRIETAIRVLRNERAAQHQMELKRRFRQQRVAKLKRRDERLAAYLHKRQLVMPC